MTTNHFLLLARFALLILLFSACQKNDSKPTYDGTWQIASIAEGTRQRIPPARWFEVNAARYAWGDGKTLTDSGVWVLDESRTIALMDSDLGTDFDSEWQLSFEKDTLVWVGTENKSNSYGITMRSVRVKEKPQHYQDKIVARWQFEEIFIDSVAQPQKMDAWIEFREGGNWVAQGDSGIWTMNPFVPILDIQSPQGTVLNEWFVLVGADTMKWVGTSTYQQDGVIVRLRKQPQ